MMENDNNICEALTKQYVDGVLKQGWGGWGSLIAAEKVFKRPLVIYENNKSTPLYGRDESLKGPPIYLHRINGNHWEEMVPWQDCKVCTVRKSGTGKVPGMLWGEKKCAACNGKGGHRRPYVAKVAEKPASTHKVKCKDCHGTGNDSDVFCDTCGGTGKEKPASPHKVKCEDCG